MDGLLLNDNMFVSLGMVYVHCVLDVCFSV